MLLVSGVSQADSLTLTCDFAYSQHEGIYGEVPANCTSEVIASINTQLNKKREKKFLEFVMDVDKEFMPEKLLRKDYMKAQPPKCPEDYKDMNIHQGGIIASSQYRTRFKPLISKYYYQVRRICLKD